MKNRVPVLIAVLMLLAGVLLMDRQTLMYFLWAAAAVAALFLYFIPSWVALYRNHPQAIPICLLNLLGGWTIAGWIGAIVWAVYRFKVERPVHGGHF